MPERPEPKPKQHHAGKTKADLKARAKILITELMGGANETQALKAAGYSASYVQSHKQTILSNPTIQRSFTAILERAGVTDDKLADKIRSLIDAKETKFFSHKGLVVDQKDVESLGIQAEMVQFAAKLKGHVIDRSVALNLNADCAPIDLSRWANKVDNPVDNNKTIDIT